MRMAAVKDTWRDALRHQKWMFKVDRLILENVKGIGNAEINFSHRFLAICGENGVGKTTLLRALFCALVPKNAEALGLRLKRQDAAHPANARCTISAKIKNEGKVAIGQIDHPEEIGIFLGDGMEESLVTYVDAASTSQRLLHLINEDAEFSTAIEGAAGAIDSAEMLALRAEITGRMYSSVKTYEVDDYSDLPTFPYFEVTVGKSKYCSEEMGLGELCANYLVWAVNRIKQDTLLLLEEPESHLPPKAQDRLMAFVASNVVQKNLNVFVSTHSEHTLENIPTSNIIFLGRLLDRFLIMPQPAPKVLFQSLRIVKTKILVVALEDHCAFAFLETILKNIDPSLLEMIDFVFKSGFGSVDAILSSFPRRKPCRVEILGVYDGDQAGEERPNFAWPHCYLPGDKDPAEYMMQTVRNNPNEFASKIVRELLNVEMVLANLYTADVKDFFPELQAALDVGIHTLYVAATEIWLKDPNNERAAKKLIKDIRAAAFP